MLIEKEYNIKEILILKRMMQRVMLLNQKGDGL